MAVNLTEPTSIYPIHGVRLATASAGIKYQGRDDLVLIELNDQAETAAVFTNNKFCAAPVQLCREHLKKVKPKYLIINAGNANAGTGQLGMNAAQATVQHIADQMDVSEFEVLPFSTGVIGEPLEVDKIKFQLPLLEKNLSEQNWLHAAKAIMTTDTVPKAFSEKIILSGKEIFISGISKGSGMIQPNMATMLAYIATDLEISKQNLHYLLASCVDESFNAITVDSDTSTNDACVLIATGESQLSYAALSQNDKQTFHEVLKQLMQRLAHAIVRDGEGASKFVKVNVLSASTIQQAKDIAYSIANSPLVKTALSASDPNWGRIMAAAGKINDSQLDLSQASLYLNQTLVLEQGELAASYSEQAGKDAVSHYEIELLIELNQGACAFTVWTTDLTHEYITINADYRS